MSQFSFGAGSLYGVRTDGTGPYTPRRFGILQECSFEFSGSLKPLYGSKRLPVAIGAGTLKTSAKSKFARISAGIFADLFFGVTPTTGRVSLIENEAGTIPATPYQVTVTNSATFSADLGVYFTLTGLPLTKVTESPTTGQYSVTSGVYTFAAADTTLGVLISYTYTVAASGKTIAITNPDLGDVITFSGYFQGKYNAKKALMVLPNCVSDKLTFGTKLEDWVIPEFDFQFFTNDADILGYIYTDE